MDFTALYSSNSSNTSPDGAYILTSTPQHLVLRDSTSFQVLQSWRTPSNRPYTNLSFSQDSLYCVAADIDTGLVNVFNTQESVDGKPAATIRAGSEGLQGVRWLDNDVGRRWLACWSRHGLRITIWNLANGKVHYIQSPKRASASGWAIKPSDRAYLAVLERHKSKDYIGIYELENLTLIRHFALATSDAQDMSWSPCGKYIAVWESSLEYGLHVYTPDGRLMHSRTSTAGATSSAPTPSLTTVPFGLGIRRVLWHPSGRFLAIGGYDEKLTIINDISWTATCEIDCVGAWSSNLSVKRAGGRLYLHKEPLTWLSQPHTAQSIVSFDLSHAPVTSIYNSAPSTSVTGPRTGKSAVKQATKDLGVTHMAFSPDAKFLVVGTASAPRKLTIIHFVKTNRVQRLRTCVKPRLVSCISVNDDVRKVSWRPSRKVAREDGTFEEEEREEGEMLAIVTGEKSLITWNEGKRTSSNENEDDESSEEEDDLQPGQGRINPGVAEGIGIPSKSEFGSLNILWSQTGDSMLLSGKESFCCAYPLLPPTS